MVIVNFLALIALLSVSKCKDMVAIMLMDAPAGGYTVMSDEYLLTLIVTHNDNTNKGREKLWSMPCLLALVASLSASILKRTESVFKVMSDKHFLTPPYLFFTHDDNIIEGSKKLRSMPYLLAPVASSLASTLMGAACCLEKTCIVVCAAKHAHYVTMENINNFTDCQICSYSKPECDEVIISGDKQKFLMTGLRI